MERAVCRSSVEIIGVDDNERTVDAVTSGEQGVSGSPGFLSPCSDADPRWGIGETLEGVLGGDCCAHPLDALVELRLEFWSNHEYDLLEPGLAGIVYGVIHERVTAGSHPVELLYGAIATRQAGGQND